MQFSEADGADGEFDVKLWHGVYEDARIKNCDGHDAPMDQ
jgi:hypothetical protein